MNYIVLQARARIHLVEVSRHWAPDCPRGNHLCHPSHSCQANGNLRIVRQRIGVEGRRATAPDQKLPVTYRSTQHLGGMGCGCGRPRRRSRSTAVPGRSRRRPSSARSG